MRAELEEGAETRSHGDLPLRSEDSGGIRRLGFPWAHSGPSMENEWEVSRTEGRETYQVIWIQNPNKRQFQRWKDMKLIRHGD